jgi:HPt (histidine-containing phosphotransfer) domain-containing protein
MKATQSLDEGPLDPGGVIDQGTIAGLRGLGPQDFRELVQMFLQEAEERVNKLLADAENGDAHAIASETHGLKGSSGAFGATRLVDLCTQIEAALAAVDEPGVRQLLYQTAVEYERARAALTEELR